MQTDEMPRHARAGIVKGGIALIFGLTGGIATGKSTVAEMFRQRGAVIVDADLAAREVVAPGTEGLRRIRERFGEEYILPSGELDRAKLGALVFSDEQARKDLNAITHPLIRQHMDQQVQEAFERDPKAIVIMDIPLLIESMAQGQKRVDKVILVYVPPHIQLQRLMQRNGYTEEEAKQRIAAQMGIEEKKKWADWLIDNSGTLEETERQVEQLFPQLQNLVGQQQGSS